MVKRCKGCSGFGYFELRADEDILDPKKEFCEECYIQLEETHNRDFTLTLEIDFKHTEADIEAMYSFLSSLGESLKGSTGYDLKVKLRK